MVLNWSSIIARHCICLLLWYCLAQLDMFCCGTGWWLGMVWVVIWRLVFISFYIPFFIIKLTFYNIFIKFNVFLNIKSFSSLFNIILHLKLLIIVVRFFQRLQSRLNFYWKNLILIGEFLTHLMHLVQMGMALMIALL